MTDEPAVRVERTCRALLTTGDAITFDAVAAHTGIGRATLYRRPELRAIVEEHRRHGRDALTLTGLQVDESDLCEQQTLCTEFDVARLTDHQLNSITVICGAAGAMYAPRDETAALETQCSVTADAALTHGAGATLTGRCRSAEPGRRPSSRRRLRATVRCQQTCRLATHSRKSLSAGSGSTVRT